MDVQSFVKGFKYTDQELLSVAQKIGKLATYCEYVKKEGSYIRVEAEHRPTEKKRDSMKVMITVKLPRDILRAESRRPNPVEAVDRCIEKLRSQLQKYKELHTDRGRAQKAQKASRRKRR